jgi:hypothetical protein
MNRRCCLRRVFDRSQLATAFALWHLQGVWLEDAALASKAVLVTGAAGFIGMQVCERLLARGEAVAGFDSR